MAKIVFARHAIAVNMPLGIAYLSAALKKAGHETELVVFARGHKRAADKIAEMRPDIVAYSVITGSHPDYLSFNRRVKKSMPGVLTLFGGPHLTFFPEMLEESGVDVVCVGEGEEAIVDFVNQFEGNGKKVPLKVPNFWIKDSAGAIHKNPTRPLIEDLDALPWPDRELFYRRVPFLHTAGMKQMMAHRGCPYKCTYCFNENYNKIYEDKGSMFRSRSPESLVEEVLFERTRAPVKYIHFVDDVFTLSRRWTLEFAKVWKERAGVPFFVNARLDNVDEEIVEAMAEAGCRAVEAGIESGDDHVRDTVMKRNMKRETIYKSMALYKKYGIRVISENVIGVPGETFEQAFATLQINMDTRPDNPCASVFGPYPKLALTRYAVENGYFDGNFDKLGPTNVGGSVLRFKDEMTKRKIINLRHFFTFLARHPHWWPLFKPLIKLPTNRLYEWFSALVAGYYFHKMIPYRMGMREYAGAVTRFILDHDN